MSRYRETYDAWKADPEGFWREAAGAIDWFTPPTRVFDPEAGVYGRWFPDATCNTCFNCIDRHVEAGRGGQAALIHDSPITGTKRTLSFAELLDEVRTLAAVLRSRGVEKGDRVIIYMPMVPEAAVAMLACARLGAVHSVVFGGFASAELATRIDDATPRAILTASCGIEPARVVEYMPLVEGALEIAAHDVETVIVLQREQRRADLRPGRLDWAEEMQRHRGEAVECVEVAATDPLYVLYTSGTTGQPKGVVRDNGGHMVALAWSMEAMYGVRPGEVFWAASDVGWVVGHSYIVYAPLLAGNTSVVFEGKPVGTPDASTFWRILAEHRVAAFFTAPTAWRAVRAQDPRGEMAKGHDLSALRTLFLAGERADTATINWLEEVSGKPVIDHWWQTETGWTIAGNPAGLDLLPVKYGSLTVPMPGYDLRVLSDEGKEVAAGTLGNVVLRLPLPPGSLPTLWNAEGRFRDAYLSAFPGFYNTSDAGMLDEDGYVFVMARTDDIINVAGHRLSTGQMEEVVASHPDVAECAVVGIADEMKGQLPLGLMILNAGVERDTAEIEREVVALVRERIGPVAAFRLAVPVKRLPKTRSGKILRATVQQLADGEDVKVPATIDDPAILDEIAAALRERGIGAGG